MKRALEALQKDFASALVAADPKARPKGLKAEDRERFRVYRNNYFAGMRDRLSEIYPLIARVLGKKAFQKAALGFGIKNPPKARTYAEFGEGFPEFLEKATPWVANLARLELAAHQVLFAADKEPLDPKSLTKMGERILQARFQPHPAARLLELAYPVLEIWQAGGRRKNPKPQKKTNYVLLTRPYFEVRALALKPGEAAFAGALMEGKTCEKAAAEVQQTEKKFNPEKAFEKLLSAGAFA